MSRARRWTIAVGACAVYASLAGCALFREGGPPPVETWPLAPAAAPVAASLRVTGELTVNGSPGDPSMFLPKWREVIAEECRGSGLFASVMENDGEADRRIEVHVVDRGEGSIAMAFITGLTLYIVPSTATDEITLRTVVKDRSGATLASYEKRETSVLWQELLLIFAMPFNFPPSESKASFRLLTRSTLAEAHAAGVF